MEHEGSTSKVYLFKKNRQLVYVATKIFNARQILRGLTITDLITIIIISDVISILDTNYPIFPVTSFW